MSDRVTVDGWLITPGYEPVAEAFEAGTAAFGKGGGAYCAYVAGVPVIDVWGGVSRPGEPWERDTLCVLMSLTKGLASLVVQQLVDRGELDLEEPVATYWPEFGQAGKDKALMRHVMMHTIGLAGPRGLTDVAQPDGSGWDNLDAISKVFETAETDWPPGEQQTYHMLTWGWIVAEIVRRVSGRTVGQYFAEEFAGPLGLDAFIGTPADRLSDVSRVWAPDFTVLPRPMRKMVESMLVSARDSETLMGRAALAKDGKYALDFLETSFNDPQFQQIEVAAGGGTATARAVARTFAMLGAGGELDGVRVLSPQIVADWSTVLTSAPDYLMAGVDMSRRTVRKQAQKQAEVPRTFGYLGNSGMTGVGNRFGPNPASIGAEGLGGQHGWFDAQSQIAAGYVRSQHATVDVLQSGLDQRLYACARRAGHDVFIPPRRSLADRAAAVYTRRLATKKTA